MNCSVVTWLVLLLLITADVYAVNPCTELVVTKSPQTLSVLRTFALDIGDVDLDGDNDVFVASYHNAYFGPSRLWLNNGAGVFSVSPQSFPVSDVHGVAIRDFNGDTYPDIFLVSQAGPSRVFFGNGSGAFVAGAQGIGNATDLPFEVKTGDVDNDGDFDVVMGTGVGPQVWVNDGTGVFTLTGTLCDGRVGTVTLADVNRDTYLDLFIALSNAPDEVWLNDGSGSFVNSGQALGSSDGFGYTTSGDVDGDGDIDVVVGNSVHGVSIWLNQNNTGTLIDFGVYLDSGSYRAGLFDADLDGDLDLITANLNTSGTKVWKNNGAGSFSLVGPILGTPSALAIGCADLDGDHDNDVVLGYGETSGGNPVYFNETANCYGTVDDIDGNTYRTVKIGNQEWMAENLRVTHYRNGDPITLATDSAQWVSQVSGAYCNYGNDTANATTYGRLYNCYAAVDARKLAPEGWHVSTDAEWKVLCDYLGGATVAGWKLKEAGTAHWSSPNSASNETNFSARPGGYRGSAFGVFADLGNYATFWTATSAGATKAWYRSISYDNPAVDLYDSRTFYGFSLRCVKDTGCCVGSTGNVNMTGIVDLSDLSLLIAYLTATPRPTLPCSTEANINAVGIVDLSDLSMLIAYLTRSPRPTLPDCP